MHAIAPKSAEAQPNAHTNTFFRPKIMPAPLSVQPQLTVGPVDDPHEREADAMADRVMRSAQPFGIQRKCAHCEEEEKVQRKPFFQRQALSSAPIRTASTGIMRGANTSAPTHTNSTGAQMHASESTSQGIRSSAGRGQPMGDDTRSFMESRFGADFSGVRIHTGSEAAGLADSIQAKAFTVGNDIWFNSGAYQPQSSEGQHLLAHELTHTLQQGGTIRRQTKSPKCTDAEVEKLNKEMHEYYNKQRTCTDQGDTCTTATAKVAAGYGAVMGRVILQQKCFVPGMPKYEEHMKKIAETNATLRNCERIMMEKCGPPALAAAAAALAAAGARKGAGKAITRMAEGMAGKAAGKAFVYASVAAAVILLMSGKAEAKISLEGDDPLVALFKAMEQDGEPVPDEFKAIIEKDPELKQALIDAARKGNMTEAQKSMAKAYSDYLKQHMNEFSEEELKALMSTTEYVGNQLPPDMKVEDLKQAIQQKANEKGNGGTGSGTGDKAPAKDTPKEAVPTIPQEVKDAIKANEGKGEGTATGQHDPAKPEGSEGTKPDDAYKQLNEENRQRIQSALPPVATLFKEFTSATEGDLKVTDESVKQFFQIVPADLTQNQSTALVSRLATVSGKTLTEVMDALKKGVAEVQKDAKPAAAGGTPADPNKKPAPEKDQTATLQELAAKKDFSKIAVNQFSVDDIASKVTGRTFTSYVFYNNNGVGMAAVISGEIPVGIDVNKLKAGQSFTVTITSLSPFVDSQGRSQTIKLKNKVTVSK